MPARLVAPGTSSDPKLQPGAYLTDGKDLYFVIGTVEEKPPYGGVPFERLRVENCFDGLGLRLGLKQVREKCRLVRPAPSCPDHLEGD